MFRSIGWQELAIVLVIVLILFGPKRLPQLGRMFGKTMKNVKDGMEGKFEDEKEDPEALEAGAKAEESTVKSEEKTTV